MTRRSIRWPMLFGVVACAGIAAAGVYLLHGWQLGRLSHHLLQLAQAEEAQAQWHKAANLLDHYVRLRPADPAIRVRLASTYGKGAKTLDERERAVALHYRALSAQTAE